MFYEVATQKNDPVTNDVIFLRGNIIQEAQIELTPSENDRYLSMFGFDHSIVDWVKFNKSVSGFNGHYSCKYLYFDVDNENLEIALDSAKNLVKGLYSNLNINPKSLFISFSGSKGFHIGLHQKLFGGFETNPKLPEQIKTVAYNVVAAAYGVTLLDIQKALAQVKVKVFKDIDFGIYNANRIFRAINSKNTKSGLYKTGLTSSELFDLNIEQIKVLSDKPRTEFKTETPVKELQANALLYSLWQDALRFDPEQYQKDYIKSQTSGASSSKEGAFFSPPTKGGRNTDLFTQACMLFDRSDLKEESVRQLVSCINLASKDPLTDSEVATIVKSAARRTDGNKKPTITTPKINNTLESFNNWLDEWVDYYTKETTKLSCLFKDIDLDNEFNYEGKLCCVIGKGGSRKSFFVQNVIGVNIIHNNARVLYSSMEMGKVEVVNRLLDLMVDPPEEKEATSETLKILVRGDKEGIRKSLKDTVSHIDENLILNNQAFMLVEDYEKLIEKTIEIYGSLQVLVVDGLSAMGGKGTETEVYSRNTLALKEIAKKYNLFVLLICHTTKEAKPYTRDPAPHVRGSEKILDNADFFVSFSQLIDPYTSTTDNLNYSRTCGHMKYWNKRGTGMTINKIFFFHSQTKRMEETATPVTEFPTYEQFIIDSNKKQKNKSKDDF